MEKIPRVRIYFILAVFGFCFVLVLGKAFKVQVLDREKLIARSKTQILRERKVFPKRGNIYDRNNRPLAINVPTYSIFTLPQHLNGDYSSYKKLAKVVKQLTYRSILKKVNKRNKYTWIARKISLEKDQVKKIKKIKGVYIESVPKRFYPNHEIMSQVLGFVGIDNVGLSGAEYYFDKSLKGEPKILKYIKDAKGRPIKFESREPGADAKDMYLSIDKDLQAFAEKKLKEAIDKHGAKSGGIGIMDARTGEVLTMANYPTFDPNYLSESPQKNKQLSFVSDPFEPGSTFKVFTIASALENKLLNPDTSYFCEYGKLKIGNHIINEAESEKKYEWLTVAEILQYSSNVGTTKIAFDLKYPKLKETLVKFGIGQKTGIELPAESRGIFTEQENVSPIRLSNISFGQGVATTGIQMLSIYSALVNKGVMFKPTILRDGNKGKEGLRVMSEKTTETLTNILVKAVESGTGANAKIKYFKIAGKTSTAQKPKKGGGYEGYVPGFIGYPVGVEKPFVVYVYIDSPKGVYYGNAVAGPVFNKVTQYLLYKNKEFNKLAIETKSEKDSFDTVNIKAASTKKSYSKDKIPSFLGLDKKTSAKVANRLGLKVIHRGIGIIKSQTPSAGTIKKGVESVILQYAPPYYE